MPAGGTIADMLDAAGLDPILIRHCHVWLVDGDLKKEPAPITRELWHRLRPKPGVVLSIRAVPADGGDGGKNPLRVVLTIAVIVASIAAPQLLFTEAFLATTTGTIAGAAVSAGTAVIGSLIVNAIAPPSSPRLRDLSGRAAQERTSPTLSITGAANRANPYGPVPRVFGRMRVFPTLAAQPFTEIVGEDQYLTMLFDFGYGPLRLSDLRIGTTPLDQFEDVELEIREGWPGDAPLSLYRDDVATDSHALELTQAAGSQVLESRSETDEISVDFAFQGLVIFDNSGNRRQRSVQVRVEYRAAGSAGAWLPAPNLLNVSPNASAPEIAAPDGALHVDYRTALPIAGAVSLTLSCPSALLTAAGNSILHAIRYRVFTRPEGAAAFVQQYESPTWLRAGESVTAALAGQAGRRLEIRIERAQVAYETKAVAPGGNGGAARAIPAPAWSYLGQTVSDGMVTFTAATEQLVRRAVTIRPGARDRYELRLQRLTADSTDEKIRDALFVTAVKSVAFRSPVNVSEHCLVGLRIRASDQLQGVIDQFSAVAQALLPVWDGAAWTVQATRSPAWAYVDVLRGRGNKRPIADARIDLDAFEAWADAAAAAPPQNDLPSGVAADADEPTWTFDAVIDYRATVFELLRDIAASARASFALVDGKYSIVRDVQQTVPVQHFTPRNSWGFRGRKTFVTLPHGLRCRFINPDKDWSQDEVIAYADGFSAENATLFETLDMFGATRRGQSWREGRYHQAVATLRPESYELSADIEHLVCTRGDLVRVTHDVPRWGLGFGRIKSVTTDGDGQVTAITLDETVAMADGLSYAVRIRAADGTSLYTNVQTQAGETDSLTLSAPVGDAPLPAAGDLVMFGEAGKESVELLVRRIRRSGDFNARLELVDHAPGVYGADAGAIPPFDPQSTIDPREATPGVVQDLRLEEVIDYVARQPVLRVVATWRPPARSLPATYEVYRRLENRWSLEAVTTAPRWEAPGLNVGAALRIAVVAVTGAGRKIGIEQAAQASLTLAGDTTRPPDVARFFVEETSAFTRRFWWELGDDLPDLAGFALRYHFGASRHWESAIPLHNGLVMAAPFETDALRYGAVTVLIKAVDTSGNESADPAAIAIGLGDALAQNLVFSRDYRALGFAGTKLACHVDVSGDLLADDPGVPMYAAGSSPMYPRTDDAPFYGAPADPMYPADALPMFTADGDPMYDAEYPAMAYRASFTPDQAGLFWLEIDADGDAELRYRVRFPDPMYGQDGEPMYTDDAAPMYRENRAFLAWTSRVQLLPQEHEIEARIAGSKVPGRIRQLTAYVDAPDVIEHFDDVAVPLAGVRLAPSKPIRVLKNVQVTLQDDGGAARKVRVLDKDPVLGALVGVFTDADAATTGTIDATTQGY